MAARSRSTAKRRTSSGTSPSRSSSRSLPSAISTTGMANAKLRSQYRSANVIASRSVWLLRQANPKIPNVLRRYRLPTSRPSAGRCPSAPTRLRTTASSWWASIWVAGSDAADAVMPLPCNTSSTGTPCSAANRAIKATLAEPRGNVHASTAGLPSTPGARSEWVTMAGIMDRFARRNVRRLRANRSIIPATVTHSDLAPGVEGKPAVEAWTFPRGSASVALMARFAAEHGVPVDDVLQGSGITASAASDPATQIDAHQELAVVRNLVGALGHRPALGLEVGR